LHVLAVQLLFHDLLQRLQNEHLGLGKGKRLVELVLQLGLGAFGSRTYSFGVISVEGARWLSVVAIVRISLHL
jgi:hypothetical protein